MQKEQQVAMQMELTVFSLSPTWVRRTMHVPRTRPPATKCPVPGVPLLQTMTTTGNGATVAVSIYFETESKLAEEYLQHYHCPFCSQAVRTHLMKGTPSVMVGMTDI